MYALIFIAVIFVVNAYFTYYQLNKYRQTISKIKQNYKNSYVATGKSRKFLSKGSLVIIVISKEGVLEYGEEMLGRTVFANFKPIDNISGLSIEEAKEKFKDSESILQAISFYEQLK